MRQCACQRSSNGRKPEAGALAGYGPRFADMYRQRARIAVKILRGAKPADIPVEIPDRYELVINLKAAKAIGHEVPAGLLLRAETARVHHAARRGGGVAARGAGHLLFPARRNGYLIRYSSPVDSR